MKSIGWDTSFHLNGKFPLLDNSIFPALNAAKKFINDQTSSAIAGTIIGVDNPSNINESGLYEIFSKSGKLALRKLVSEDTLAEYKEGVDTIINNYEGNYSSLLLELAAALAELLEALRGEIFSPDNDTTPVTRTMMLLVGSDSTNYRFSTTASGGKDTDGVVFNTESKTLLFLDGVLYHFSIVNEDGIPKQWSIEGDSIIELDSTESTIGKYMNISTLEKGNSLWIYARVKRNGRNGNWFISPEKYGCALKEDEVLPEGVNPGNSNYYYLLYGFCGVTKVGTPFFEPIYGNTWIKGSTIYTGKVLTMDGFSSLDLDNNTLKLGNDFYYANGQIIIGNPETGAFVFHKHRTEEVALHIGTQTLDSEGNESWNGMTFADGELTIGKYDEKLQKMQELLDKEVSTWYGNGIPLPYKENTDGEVIDEVSEETLASYNNDTLILDEDGVWKFNLSPDPELLTYHINDIYINTESGVGYRLVVTNYGETTLQVYWLKLSLGDLLNILNSINSINSLVENIKEVLDITEDGQTTIGDKFVQTMMLRIGADSTNYTLSKTSTSGNRMKNLYWTRDTDEDGNEYTALRATESETLKHESYYYTTTDGRKIYIWDLNNSFDGSEDLVTVWDNIEYDYPIYLYIKCSTVSNSAGWYSSVNTHSLLEEIEGKMYYFFPFATITDPKNKELVEVRGNTKIIGDRIITGKLESNTGNSFFDLDNGLFALGVDLSDPDDLSKAAFSFDGNTVHIAGNLGLDYRFDLIASTSTEFKVDFLNGQAALESKYPMGSVFIQNIFSDILKGEYKLSISSFSLNIDPLINEGTFGIEESYPYCICIGAPQYDEGGYITNTLININSVTHTCEFSIVESSDLYIIRGTNELKDSSYSFKYVITDSPDPGYVSFVINSIILSKRALNTKDIPLRELLEVGSTDINGGLVLTNCLGVRNNTGIVTAGISGILDEDNKTAFWAGDILENKETAPVRLTFDGIDSKIGPLKILSRSTIVAEKLGSTHKCIIDTTDDPCIEIKNGSRSLKLISSEVPTDLGAIYNTTSLWSSGILLGGTYMNIGSPQTSILIKSGTIGLKKIDESSSGLYTHSVTSYTTYPTPTTFLFIGSVKNANNKFGLSAEINLYINNTKRVTLASITNPINVWLNRLYGYDELDSNRAAFLVTFLAVETSPNITINDFGKSYSILLDITHLSRWWANTASSGTIYIKDGVENDDALSEWSINLVSSSDLLLNCTYSATLKEGGSGTIGISTPLGLVSSDGYKFINGKNLLATSVNEDYLTIVLGNLPTSGSAVPLGIDSNGRLCRMS